MAGRPPQRDQLPLTGARNAPTATVGAFPVSGSEAEPRLSATCPFLLSIVIGHQWAESRAATIRRP